jgi:serine phosphatase RsbU (regulator of sigma subunit)
MYKTIKTTTRCISYLFIGFAMLQCLALDSAASVDTPNATYKHVDDTLSAVTNPPASIVLDRSHSDEYILRDEDLGYLVLGIIFVAIGFITLLLTILRTASRDASVFLFATMSCIWGIRFLLYTQIVPMILVGDAHALQRTARGFTYFGAAAAFGFAWAYLGSGWRSSLRGLAQFSLAFSLIAAVALLLNPDRDLLLPAFSVMILIGAAIVIANMFHPDVREKIRRQGLIAGSCISAIFFALENLRSLNIIPVPFDVEWIGVLILYTTLGRIIAVRMFSSERRLAAIDQELATARQIQGSLLPREAPAISGLSVAARYVPMTEVAGDIYDFFEVDNQRLGILIADVSGHGVPAALIASMVKGAFRAQIETIDKPDRVLEGMNRILEGQLGRNYITAGCAFIDTGKRYLSYAAAGHPPLLIQQRERNTCICLQRTGVILGPFSRATYDRVERPLAPGDRLLLYTDGIIEAANAEDKQFGENSLQRFLAQHGHLSGESFADALLQTVVNWVHRKRDESLDDDLTLVVIDVDD